MNTLTAARTHLATTLSSDRAAKIFLLLSVLGLVSGCGANTTARNASSSNPTPTIYYPTTTTNGASASQCNYFDSTAIRLQGKVTTYYWNGVLQEDKIRLRITGLTDQFDSNTNLNIQVFRWKAETGSAPVLDSNALSFTVYKGDTGSTAISNAITSINATQIANMRSSGGITGTTAVDFFGQTTLVISGVDYNWDALKVVVYDGTTALGQADFLLPVFAANPNVYSTDHPTVLSQLHPFWSQRTQSVSDSDWGSRTTSFCF